MISTAISTPAGFPTGGGSMATMDPDKQIALSKLLHEARLYFFSFQKMVWSSGALCQ
jgi:hypothetical protein